MPIPFGVTLSILPVLFSLPIFLLSLLLFSETGLILPGKSANFLIVKLPAIVVII